MYSRVIAKELTAFVFFFLLFPKILNFIVAHSEVFSDILQDQTSKVTVSSLHELYLVSGIVCKSGLTEDTFVEEEALVEDLMKFRAPLSRIQRLMLALLPKYSVRENWDRVSG